MEDEIGEMWEVRAEVEALEAKLADAEARAAHYHEERDNLAAALREAQGRIGQLEEEVATLRRELEAVREEARGLRDKLREAVARYREARLAAAPHVPGEMVTGETLEEVEERFRQAERIVSELRRQWDEEAQALRLPLGSPPRRPPDLSGLSPLEKIRRGLQRI